MELIMPIPPILLSGSTDNLLWKLQIIITKVDEPGRCRNQARLTSVKAVLTEHPTVPPSASYIAGSAVDAVPRLGI